MTRDRVVLAVLVVAFATLVTAHVGLCVGLARRTPRWRSLVAFMAPPLAPWWGWQNGMRVRGLLWIGAAVLYGVMFALSSSK